MTGYPLPRPLPAPARGIAAGYDVVAIGCGPFNLGLAALASGLPGLELAVFEAKAELRWHPGMMFEEATLQLSFLADLVTLVDPTHPLSFLAYLRDQDRMYPFFIREQFHPTRREYEDYLRWAAGLLSSVHFSHRVEEVRWDDSRSRFEVSVRRPDGTQIRAVAKHLVVGIGTEPMLPKSLEGLPPSRLLHSADYLHRLCDVERARHITLIGSGQSASEIAVDLLRRNLDGGPPITWVTRTRSFAPLDYSKLVLEMTTPAYIRYFHGLPQETKDRLNGEQWQHYKGISIETIEQIHDLLYRREMKHGLAEVELRCATAVETALEISVENGGESSQGMDASGRSGTLMLGMRHRDTDTLFSRETDLVVAATGYRERKPEFLTALEPLLRRDALGRYRVRQDYSIELDDSVTGNIFVVNAELHSHGVASPDLGVSAFRNATILNTIAGTEFFRLPRRTAFTRFTAPHPAHVPEEAAAGRPMGKRTQPMAWAFRDAER